MLSGEQAIQLYQLLCEHNIQVWVSGGWGIDALLGRQTRPHKDLDVIMLLRDVTGLQALLGRDGFMLKQVWEENLWAAGEHGEQLLTAFVLRDALDREIDAHALVLDELGFGIPAWDSEGRIFTPDDLSGEGRIGGKVVRCLSAPCQLACHTGYTLPEAQVRDLQLLQEFIEN